MKKAIALSPVHPTWYHFPIGWHYYWNGEYEAALAEAKKIELPGYFATYQLLATVYAAMGRVDDARAAATRLLDLFPAYPREFRHQMRKWNVPESMIEHLVLDMRRAGLEVPEGT
jgi:hypothetical protein